MGTMTCNLHHITSIEADSRGPTAWVSITGDGGKVTLFVDGELARRLEDAFTEYENWLSGQEGPTFDGALAVKCDARAREDAARALK